MANNIIIRKAKADYVCQICGHIIKAGTDYLDRVVLNNGKCVQHERYHDECPKISKLCTQLFKYDEPTVCMHNGTKYWLVGMCYATGTKQAVIKEWNSDICFHVDEAVFNKEWTCNE